MASDDLADAYERALALEKAGRLDDAARAYADMLKQDPSDPGGVAVRLAALRRGPVPARASEAYVEMLFDQHADAFEHILVDQLKYGVPGLVRKRLDALGLGPFARFLDLGCGTGLAMEALSERVGEAIGIDLSERMIDICEDKDIYDGLYVGEVVAFLEDNDEDPFDLITACDVLPYLGELAPLVTGAATNLGTGGLFAFSSETMATDEFAGAPYTVGAEHRFAHAEPYVRQVLANAGMGILSFEPISVRLTDGQSTPGHLVIARKD